MDEKWSFEVTTLTAVGEEVTSVLTLDRWQALDRFNGLKAAGCQATLWLHGRGGPVMLKTFTPA